MSERLVILSWLWDQPGGRAKFTADHVNIWRAMLRRHLTIDHELACVTDTPESIDPGVRIIPPPRDFEGVRIPTWREKRPQCFRRLALFRSDAADIFGGDRLVSMDLDIVVLGNLDSLFTGGEDFRICRGTSARRAYNGSIYMLRAGAHPKVYAKFTPERAIEAGRKHVGSDQSWIARCLPGAPTWGPDDGIVSWQNLRLASRPRLVTFPGVMKPWQIEDRQMTQHYRGDDFAAVA